MKKQVRSILILLQLFFFLNAPAATVYVNPGDDLDAKIESASGGDVVIIRPGTYGKVQLVNKNFSPSNPLVIKSDGTGTVTIANTSNTGGKTFELINCSYIVLEDVVLESGTWGVYVRSSDHIIIKDCEVKNQGQEGIHIGEVSKYVDVTGCHIHNTGTYNAQWGEGIYIGTGSYHTVSFPDNTEHIWIENNTIHDCGNGEAINVKGECFHVTLKGNTIYNISPGTSSQYNQAAISFEGPNNSISNNYRLNESRDLWAEDNDIDNISGGHSDYDNGIMFTGAGVNIVGNDISNCDNRGLYGNNYATLGLPIYIYNNTFSSNGQDTGIGGNLSVNYSNPGSNPNGPQLWYNTTVVPATGVSLNTSSFTIGVTQTFQLLRTVLPSNATNKAVTWSSSNSAVASVDSNGLVTGVSAGTATITVTTNDGSYTDTCTVTVTSSIGSTKYEAEDGTLSGVTVESIISGYSGTGYIALSSFNNNSDVILVDVNAASAGDYTLYIGYRAPDVKYNDVFVNNVKVGDNVLFPVSASFTELEGITIPLNSGNNTVELRRRWGRIDVDYFRIEGLGGSEPVTGISLNTSSISLNVGSTSNLSATVSPSNASDQSVTWSSSNSSVATVNSSGIVTAVSSGSATITVTTNDGNFTDTCMVTVSSSNTPVTGVSLSKSSLTLNVGGTLQLLATILPSNASDQSVSWSSSNTSIATVDSNGNVDAVSTGSATITVTTNDGSYTSDCAVTVNASSGFTIYEAEDGTLSGVTVENSVSGYSGTGYVARNSFDSNSDVIAVSVNAASAGNYILHIGYRAPAEKYNDVYVNNVKEGNNIYFPVSSSFTETSGIPIPLNAGSNTVEIRRRWGWIDVDYFKVIGVGLTGTSLHRLSNTADERINLYTIPKLDDSFDIDLSGYSPKTKFNIVVYDFTGKIIRRASVFGGQFYRVGELSSKDILIVNIRSKDINLTKKILLR